MSKRVSRLLFEVLVGLFVAGGLAPLAVLYLPVARRSAWIVWTIAIACVAGTSIVRRLAAGSAGSGAKQDGR